MGYDMSCFCCHSSSVEDQQRVASRRIDRELERERRRYEATIRLLLLGAGESGKSTFVKQMQIINMQGFSSDERMAVIKDVYGNVRDAMVTLLGAMKSLGIVFGDCRNTCVASRVLDGAADPNFKFSKAFFDDCQSLWADTGVQACFKRSNEFHLIDSAKFFLDKVSDLSLDTYVPSDQDMLRCRILTTQIAQIKFCERDVTFHMFDVGGQRSQRRKWIQCFHDVTAIVFFAETSGFNQTLREDGAKNRLQESLDLFREVWINRFLQRVPVILFLNKQDLLKEKIVDLNFKLEQYFPEFEYCKFALSPTISLGRKQSLLEESGSDELYRAKCFIRNEFMKIADTTQHSTMHMCYPHFTCAVDTDNIRKVFDDCKNIIRKVHLDRFGILPADST